MFIFIHIILLLCLSSSFCSFIGGRAKDGHDLLWCNRCGVSIGDTSYLFSKSSPGALKAEYRDVFGHNVTVQTLMNPFHFMFDVITTEKASCADLGRNSRGDSWFPGYSWRICTCPSCAAQLGWTFERALSNSVEDTNDNKTFHALILSNLHGVDINSRIITMTSSEASKDSYSSTKPSFQQRASDKTSTLNTMTTMSPIQPRARDETVKLPVLIPTPSPADDDTTSTNNAIGNTATIKQKMAVDNSSIKVAAAGKA